MFGNTPVFGYGENAALCTGLVLDLEITPPRLCFVRSIRSGYAKSVF